MATQTQALTDNAATDIKAALSLADDTAYSIEIASGQGAIFYEAATPPAPAG